MPTPNAPPDGSVARFSADLTALTGPLRPDQRIGVAVSGGPDSLALLLLAHAALPGRILAATVDHGLRPEAAGEAAMVGEICDAIAVPHAILRPAAPVGPGGNIQERARIARYSLLAQWGDQRGLTAIATAHHRDDVAETFLMRALRGSGAGGLARMSACGPMPYGGDSKIRLIRPLLEWSRGDLAEIAGVDAVQDPSNSDIRYDRARIRTMLGREPLLDAELLSRAATNLADAEAALVWMTDLAWRSRAESVAAEIRIDPDGLPVEIRRRLAARAIAALTPAWDGEGLDRLVETIERRKTATLGGIKASGGALWHFRVAPARRRQR